MRERKSDHFAHACFHAGEEVGPDGGGVGGNVRRHAEEGVLDTVHGVETQTALRAVLFHQRRHVAIELAMMMPMMIAR